MNSPSPRDTTRNSRVMGWLACAFIVIAIIFALIPMGSGIPITEPVSVSKEDIATTPRFTTMGDDAMAVVAGFKRNCMDCHEIIDGKPRNEDLLQHKNIHMDHGLNGRCINCHDPKDRDKLILRDGKNVGYSQSPLLCAQCHGTTYRQWQRKVHGKTLGYWDSSKGEAKTLLCVECHNPHSPRYAPMTPLPAPNTLRMGDQSGGVHHEEGDKRSPLSPDYGSHRRHQKSQPTGH